MNKICDDFKHSVSVVTSESMCQLPKLESFSVIDIHELRKVMKKVKDTFSDNDPVPISELKNSNNFDLVENVYPEIVNLGNANSVFPHSEKLSCINPRAKVKAIKKI